MKLDVGAVQGALIALRVEIARVANAAGRDPAAIALLGVTKGQPRARVLEAIEAGIQEIGENYAQEAKPKYAGVHGARKHFIGHIQTNKAKSIVETFDVVQTVDRLEAGLAIVQASRELAKRVSALIQVKIAPDKRFGVEPEQAGVLADRLRGEGLAVDGVMAIGPNTADPAQVTRAFGVASRAYDAVGGGVLSLGMSSDWPQAVACGSTMLRIGTAIFGERA